MMMWGWGSTPMSWGWALFGLASMALFWGIIAFLVVWAVRALRGSSAPSAPLEIAQRRYAAGEITREQYEQLRRDLSS